MELKIRPHVKNNKKEARTKIFDQKILFFTPNSKIIYLKVFIWIEFKPTISFNSLFHFEGSTSPETARGFRVYLPYALCRCWHISLSWCAGCIALQGHFCKDSVRI